MVAPEIAVEVQPWSPIFEKCPHLREKGGVLTKIWYNRNRLSHTVCMQICTMELIMLMRFFKLFSKLCFTVRPGRVLLNGSGDSGKVIWSHTGYMTDSSSNDEHTDFVLYVILRRKWYFQEYQYLRTWYLI